MKKLLLLFAPILLSAYVSAQTADQRLLSSYSQQELNEIKTNDPRMINMLNYALDHACYITDLPSGKSADLGNSMSVDINKAVCFADLGLKIEDHNQYLPVKGTSKMLVVKSTFVLRNELKNATHE
jgi:hypothetical protein